MRFVGLIVRNVAIKPIRTLLTVLAVSIGVAATITMGVVTHSLRSTAVQILQIGQADFSVSQKGVADVLNSAIDQGELGEIAALPQVQSTTGVLVAPVRLNADNPFFLRIGIDPQSMEEFGVRVVTGEKFAATATDEIMLGYRAARNLGKTVGDVLTIEDTTYRVVGIFATDQEFGDAASMLPLVTLQAQQRQTGDVTIAFVRVDAGADVDAVRARIEGEFPQLITVRTVAEFGRADRNLALLTAADDAVSLVAIVFGVIIVTNTMLLTFTERIREFGVLGAIGWSRVRIMLMVFGETFLISLLGAATGVGFSFLGVQLLQHVSSLQGVLRPAYTSAVFARALGAGVGIGFLGAQYPAMRAAFLVPLEALRRE